ncbi:MAG TPA: sigma-70 family RNA polymerase sigma factor [Nocardioidaceae bacterium]|nr:sigma-70 family RNA polymerase sigma factor [Nocardioidaceae bacterium]
MTPARVLASERPLRRAAAPDRSLRERPQPAPARGRSAAEVDALVRDHLPLAAFAVNAVAARISLPGHVSRDDLLSCAHVALVEVAQRFDPAAGASFATYALARLQGAVLDELRSGDWASRSVRAAARRTDAAADALAMSLGRPPTKEELAASLGVDRSELDALQVDVHRAVMVSIDAETGPDGGSLDLPSGGDSPERALLRSEQARHLHEAIRALPDRLDEVIERNFFGDESLTDIAADLGVTLSRVSQMRARALVLLHAAMSEIWDGKPVPADGGVRARNQQRAYLDRVGGRRPLPAPTAAPLPRPGATWPVPRRTTGAAQPA